MTRRLKCVIVDDEPIAREGIASYVRKIDWLECVGMFDDALAFNVFLSGKSFGIDGAKSNVDIIFIDIEMPVLSGLDYIASISTDAAVIVITAYEEYALRGYELNITDYLLKPVSFVRFFKAVNKAREYCTAMERMKIGDLENDGDSVIFVKSDKMIHRIDLNDVYFVEGMENYVKIYTENGIVVTRASLKSFIELLPDRKFMQIHKSYLVNLHRIETVEGNMIHFKDRLTAPVSRSYKQKLLDKLT